MRLLRNLCALLSLLVLSVALWAFVAARYQCTDTRHGCAYLLASALLVALPVSALCGLVAVGLHLAIRRRGPKPDTGPR